MIALCLGARSHGRTRIRKTAHHPDVDGFLATLHRLGISVACEDGAMATGAEGQPAAEWSPSEEPLVASSKIQFACLAGLLASAPFPQAVMYDGVRKDIRHVLDALEALDVRIRPGDTESEKRVFLTIGGRRPKPGTVRLTAVDEAAKAAVFLAALGADGDVECFQPGAGDDTVEPLFRAAGCTIEKERISDDEGYRLSLSGPASPQGVEHHLPGDPDAALYLLLTAALLPKSELLLTNVGVDWKSRRIVEVLRRMNAGLAVERARTDSRFPIRRITAKGSELRSTRIGGDLAELFLNELPFLSVVGACAAGEAIIRDALALRNGHRPQVAEADGESLVPPGVVSAERKDEGDQEGDSGGGPAEETADREEGDTLAITVSAVRELGVKVGEMPDGLVVQGGHILQGTRLDAGGDVRVAVALLLAGMAAEGTTVVVNAGPVDARFGPVLEIASNLAQRRRVVA